jgi:hypothetical protein
MYGLDFASVIVGYVVGVLLCYSTTHILFVEADDENK